MLLSKALTMLLPHERRPGCCCRTWRFGDGCQSNVQVFPQHLSPPTAFLSVADCQKDVPATPLWPHTHVDHHVGLVLLEYCECTMRVPLRESFSNCSGDCASSEKLPCGLCFFWSCWTSGNPRDSFAVWSSNSLVKTGSEGGM